ncbi:MAG: hypothetical protein AAF492_09440, partial [Verrucomicrobiota bacterium]
MKPGVGLVLLLLSFSLGCSTRALKPIFAPEPGPQFFMPESFSWQSVTQREHPLFGKTQLTEHFVKRGKRWRTEV